jgi:glycine/D-amino acid oxidase-like deaminating enzyme
MTTTRVAVLGAGLQGACTALELARRGARVDLIDQDALAVNRASARNEGKIHLGFVYAKDETLRTARLMVRGALAFRPLLSRWTGGAFDRLAASAPFSYLVPYDSAWSPGDLAHHYAAVQELYAETRRAEGGDYLGQHAARLWRRLEADEYAAFAAPSRIQAGFATAEVSIPVGQTAAILRGALAAAPGIALCLGHRVRAVERGGAGFRVEGSTAVGPFRLECEQVVNALWDGRLAVDAAMGLQPTRPWVHRLKFRVLAELPERLRAMPSCTFVLGPYGDVVRYADGPACVSWYPQCLRGWSADVVPPPAWDAACAGAVPAAVQAAVAADALRDFDALVPGLAAARVVSVDAGVIFAWGDSDITDPGSELHRRHDTGVASRDGYHSVNTGTLTTAPLFAEEAADRILGARAWAAAEPELGALPGPAAARRGAP